MLSYPLVLLPIILILDNKYHIKARKDSCLEVHILAWSFYIIVAAEYGVGSCKH